MAAQRERSLADVFQDIVANVQDIVRSELRLASVEIRQELVKAATAGKVAAAGGVLALFALAFLLLAAVYGLALVMPPWMAALAVGIVLAMGGLILISAGSKRLKLIHLKPEKTVASIRETLHG
jgi:uncharacterized membrane protein YqjE